MWPDAEFNLNPRIQVKGRLVERLASNLAGNLDFAAAEQMCRFGGGTRGKNIRVKKFTIDVIHGIEIVQIGEMHLDLDHVVTTQLQFIENIANDAEHGASFRADIAEHVKSGGKICRDQAGKEGVMIVQHHLAEWCPGCRNGSRLDSG